MSENELEKEYMIGEGRYIIAIDKRAAHLFVFLLAVATLVYWADALGIYSLLTKTEREHPDIEQ